MSNDELVTKLVEAIAPVIEKHSGDGLTLADVRQAAREEAEAVTSEGGLSEERAIELINEHAATEDRIVELVEQYSGDGSGLNQALQMIIDPDNIGTLAENGPSGEMHEYHGWGPVYEVTEPCHLGYVTIDSAGSGAQDLRVWELDSDEFDANISDEPYREREIRCHGGEQEVPIQITLEPGVYWFERAEHDNMTELRRIEEADADEINDTDAPIQWLRGWHPDYRPQVDEGEYNRFMDNGWNEAYHYFFELEVGYQD